MFQFIKSHCRNRPEAHLKIIVFPLGVNQIQMGRTTKKQPAKITYYHPKQTQASSEETQYARKCQYRSNKNKNKKFRSRCYKEEGRKSKHQTQEVTKILNKYYKNDYSLLANLKEEKQRILESSSEQLQLGEGKEMFQLDKAIKRLERRECFDEFRGHRNNTALYKKDLYRRTKSSQQRAYEMYKEYGWYCPSCFGDVQYEPPFQPEYDQCQDMGELAECLVYVSGDTVMKQLEGRDMWDYEELFFGESRITDNGVKSLSMGLWDGLLSLYLGVNNINNISCKYIAKMEMPLLVTLDLGQNPIQAEGFRYLQKAKLPDLQEIFLCSNVGLSFLWKGHFPKLSKIHLTSFQFEKDIRNGQISDYIQLVKMESQCIQISPIGRQRSNRRRSQNNYFVPNEWMRMTMQTLERILKEKNYIFWFYGF